MYINTELRHYSRAVFLSGECIEYRREGFLKHLRLMTNTDRKKWADFFGKESSVKLVTFLVYESIQN